MLFFIFIWSFHGFVNYTAKVVFPSENTKKNRLNNIAGTRHATSIICRHNRLVMITEFTRLVQFRDDQPFDAYSELRNAFFRGLYLC